jgi:hypothetical protein
VARTSVGVRSPVWTGERKLLFAAVGLQTALSGGAALPASLRTGGCGLCCLALQANGTAARLEYFDETLRKRFRTRIASHTSHFLQVVEGAEDVGTLPRGQVHTAFISADRVIGLNSR